MNEIKKNKKKSEQSSSEKKKISSTGKLTDELSSVLETITEEPGKKASEKGEKVTLLNEADFLIGEKQYKLVKNHRDAFQTERLGERFSDVLNRYDYIVGDWGYDQLRLKGFFHDENRKAPIEQRIGTLEDYLYEYCNFGCPYFVIERVGGKREKQQKNKKRKPVRKNPTAHTQERTGIVPEKSNKNMKIKKTPVIRNRDVQEKQDPKQTDYQNKTRKPVKVSNEGKKHQYTIRQKETNS